jgi:hypothetical protein
MKQNSSWIVCITTTLITVILNYYGNEVEGTYLSSPISCIGNFTVNFDEPDLSFLPPVGTICGSVEGSVEWTDCASSPTCELPSSLIDVTSIYGQLSLIFMKDVPVNKIKTVDALVVVLSTTTSLDNFAPLTTANNVSVLFTSATSLKGLGNIVQLDNLELVLTAISTLSSLKLQYVQDTMSFV